MKKVFSYSYGGLVVVGLLLGAGHRAFAEETSGEKAESVINEGVDATKRAYRDAKDKACEMVNGKMECVAKKMMHKGETVKDTLERNAKKTKNKID